MTSNASIMPAVMRRVRIIHATRLLAPSAIAAVVLATALWGIGKLVWVAKVFENMPSLADVPAVLGFYVSAFVGTGALEQALCVAVLGASAWLVVSAERNLRVLFRFA